METQDWRLETERRLRGVPFYLFQIIELAGLSPTVKTWGYLAALVSLKLSLCCCCFVIKHFPLRSSFCILLSIALPLLASVNTVETLWRTIRDLTNSYLDWLTDWLVETTDHILAGCQPAVVLLVAVQCVECGDHVGLEMEIRVIITPVIAHWPGGGTTSDETLLTLILLISKLTSTPDQSGQIPATAANEEGRGHCQSQKPLPTFYQQLPTYLAGPLVDSHRKCWTFVPSDKVLNS